MIFNLVGGAPPVGSITITENGTHDVTDYATAVVNVSGGGGGVETASVTLTAVNGIMPSNIYYTDANMTVHHVTTGAVSDTLMPVGSIIYCRGSEGPATGGNVGITPLYVAASARALNAAYEVTG